MVIRENDTWLFYVLIYIEDNGNGYQIWDLEKEVEKLKMRIKRIENI